ncbi:MAG TPA: glycine zipper family protein [Nitrospiraceae bacterium]|nr:glycine zipper family protein [Nitrospiraceae bacterium]
MEKKRKMLMMEIFCVILSSVFLISCATSYQAQPLPFKVPSAYPNAQNISGATVGAKAYADADEARETFGFDIRAAGMLPVQVVFDNQGKHTLEINSSQTFLEDNEGNLWPILASDIAYERATKYAQTKEIFKEGAYHGFLGAIAGATIGAAIGIVTGQDVAKMTGRGAALGAASGAVIGGAKGYDAKEAQSKIIDDLKQKSLQSKPIESNTLAYGIIFFPGEVKSVKQVRMQIVEKDTGAAQVLILKF